MSINNLEKTFENNSLLYCNLNNEIIIECIRLTELYIPNEYNEYIEYNEYNENKKFVYVKCDKVKIITIYDIYKNIIFKPIQIDLFKDPIKINGILENLKGKDIYFFKTFIGAFLINNKLNNIKYNTNYDNIKFAYNFSYDNTDIFIYNFDINPIIYNNKRHRIYNLYYEYYTYFIQCYYNENCIIYNIDNDYIEIEITKKTYSQTITFHKKDLKIFKIKEYYKHGIIYYEKRNYNNEIINWKKNNNNSELIEEFISNNINPPFSKPFKKYYIESINHYNKNIIFFFKIFKSIFKKIKEAYYNLLLKYNLEMIDFK